jgi:hypothetical protein
MGTDHGSRPWHALFSMPCRTAVLAAAVGPIAYFLAPAGPLLAAQGPAVADDSAALLNAQRCFYNAHYAEAAAATLELRAADPDELGGYELRSSALLFQLKRALGVQRDRDEALKQCAACADLMIDFARETERGQSLARARLAADPQDDAARFFLAKIDLNYVWLELGTLGRKKGWSEYWEARRGLDAVLRRHPGNVRARVARAWIDYIVDTKIPRGTKWVLGGGSRQRALLAVREAASADGDFYVRVEAAFALWEMEARERNVPEAIAVAQGLARDFPENHEVAAFLSANQPDGVRARPAEGPSLPR